MASASSPSSPCGEEEEEEEKATAPSMSMSSKSSPSPSLPAASGCVAASAGSGSGSGGGALLASKALRNEAGAPPNFRTREKSRSDASSTRITTCGVVDSEALEKRPNFPSRNQYRNVCRSRLLPSSNFPARSRVAFSTSVRCTKK